MSETWKVQASFKFGQGQHMLNVRGDNAADINDQLNNLSTLDVLGNVTATGALLQAVDNGATGLTQVPAAAPVPAQPAPVATPPQTYTPPAPAAPPQVGAAPSCAHGVRQFKSGAGAKGPWQAYMCPAQRDDPSKCQPQWIR